MKYLNEVSYKDCVGKIFKSKSSGDFKVLKYNDGRNVEIQFVNTSFETVTRLECIKNGSIKDPYSPSVYGIGVLGTKYLTTINGVKTCTSMFVTEFEKGYIEVEQRYFYVVYQYDKEGIKYTATSYSITDDGSHFNLNVFVSNVEKYENGSNVIVTNFIEFKTEKTLWISKGVSYECIR